MTPADSKLLTSSSPTTNADIPVLSSNMPVPDGIICSADPLAMAAEADGINVRKIERWKALSKEGGHTLQGVLEDYRSVQPDLNVLAFVTQVCVPGSFIHKE